jgi:hypothetical protein
LDSPKSKGSWFKSVEMLIFAEKDETNGFNPQPFSSLINMQKRTILLKELIANS